MFGVGLFFEGYSLTWPLKQRWFWMLFFLLTMVLIVPLLLLVVILTLSPSSIVVAFIVIVVVWYVFKSYRSWTAKKEEESGDSQPSPIETARS
jgi:uncharacterized membrane protein YqjE